VRDIPGDTDDAAITTAITAMAHSLKIGSCRRRRNRRAG